MQLKLLDISFSFSTSLHLNIPACQCSSPRPTALIDNRALERPPPVIPLYLLGVFDCNPSIIAAVSDVFSRDAERAMWSEAGQCIRIPSATTVIFWRWRAVIFAARRHNAVHLEFRQCYWVCIVWQWRTILAFFASTLFPNMCFTRLPSVVCVALLRLL